MSDDVDNHQRQPSESNASIESIESIKAIERKPRYFERPDENEKPLSLLETLIIIFSTHLGVRPKANREEDFRRANGLHLFIAGAIYFALLITALIFLVRYITRH